MQKRLPTELFIHLSTFVITLFVRLCILSKSLWQNAFVPTSLVDVAHSYIRYQNIITAQGKIIQEQEAAAAAAAAARANSSSSSPSYDGGGAGKGGSIASDYAAGGGKNPGASTGVSGSSVVSYAMQFVGNPYVWGGNSLTNGVDCSGFVHEVYAHFGISTPRYSQAFKSVGQAVSFDNIQPGDVVVYPGHVAIYAGGGVIVEAQSTKAGITANRSVQCHTILAIRRLV